MATRRSKVWLPRPPWSRPAKRSRRRLSTRFQSPIDPPSIKPRAASKVLRIFSPPGTSPAPVRPALSVRMTKLRVKNGPCAPLKLSSIPSRPATGMTRIWVTTGVPGVVGVWAGLARGERGVVALDIVQVGGQLVRGASRVWVLRKRSRLLLKWVRMAARAASVSWLRMALKMLSCSPCTFCR